MDHRIDPQLLAATHRAAADSLPVARPVDPRELASMPRDVRMWYERQQSANRARRHAELAGLDVTRPAVGAGLGWQPELTGAAAQPSSGMGWQTTMTGYSPSPFYPHVHHAHSRHARGHGVTPGAGASMEETREGVAGFGFAMMPIGASPPPGSTPITSTAPAPVQTPPSSPWWHDVVMAWGDLVDTVRSWL